MEAPPIILGGQLYLDTRKNAYLIVTKTRAGTISYSGIGFKGMLEDEQFILRFLPVDPADVANDELDGLIDLCPDGTQPRIGFFRE